MSWPSLARAAGTDPRNGTARRARDDLLADGTLHRHPDGSLAVRAGYQLPDRELRRQLYPQEEAAQVDFAQMEHVYIGGRASLIEDYRAAQQAQIDELVEQVADADSAAQLAALQAAPADPGIVEPHLATAAAHGVSAAGEERNNQLGADPPPAPADQEAIDTMIAERAHVVVTTLAAGLSAAASKRASALYPLAADKLAARVREHLEGLSDAELLRQLGGAVMASYGKGRLEFMRAQVDPGTPPAATMAFGEGGTVLITFYASEVMDSNTCVECADIDGTEWSSLAEAEEFYPLGGGYVACLGGLLCRGTLIAVYEGVGGRPGPEPTAPAVPIPPGRQPREEGGG